MKTLAIKVLRSQLLDDAKKGAWVAFMEEHDVPNNKERSFHRAFAALCRSLAKQLKDET